MNPTLALNRADTGREKWHDSSDEEIVARVRGGERDLFEVLMRRHNQRLYRVARAVLRDDGEAQDVAQEAWVQAFAHLDQFAGRARFSTWLTRIALYAAWDRARRRGRLDSIDTAAGEKPRMTPASPARSPEREAYDRELAAVLESAVESLPDVYRSVFVLREIEALSTAETAECLELTEETVKTRLYRARGLLRRDLLARAGTAAGSLYSFAGDKCDRMVASVFARIGTGLESGRVEKGSHSPPVH